MPLNEKLSPTPPKRILSLDGGGVRGALTLGFLEKLEKMLRERHGNPDLLLSDYFDLMGGTSTGAIIASALAIGKSVSYIKEKYLSLGTEVFKKSWWNKTLAYTPLRKATFKEDMLEVHLKNIFGDINLGGEEIKTGLCIICKRADTQSVWPLINHPGGKFFDGDMGRNKNIKLREAIRASTAAPTYFVPTKIEHGGLDGIRGAFVDGGVSMANNPSLQLLMVATLSGFPFHWQKGEDKLMIVSFGTGFAVKKNDPDSIVARWLKDWAMEVPDMLMDDASRQNELLLQWMSNSPTARYLDMEIESLENDMLCEKPLLTYLRYNVKMDRETLSALGLGSFSKDEIASLTRMENAENMEQLFEIGSAAAQHYMMENHLPKAFDIR